jgi:hypothetical protein
VLAHGSAEPGSNDMIVCHPEKCVSLRRNSLVPLVRQCRNVRALRPSRCFRGYGDEPGKRTETRDRHLPVSRRHPGRAGSFTAGPGTGLRRPALPDPPAYRMSSPRRPARRSPPGGGERRTKRSSESMRRPMPSQQTIRERKSRNSWESPLRDHQTTFENDSSDRGVR